MLSSTMKIVVDTVMGRCRFLPAMIPLLCATLSRPALAQTPNMAVAVGWGANSHGQTSTPADLANIIQIACGSQRTYALKSDGTLVEWGNLAFGQPIPSGLEGVTQIACGGFHNYALKNDGTIVGWSATPWGSTTIPAEATSVIQIASGSNHAYALRGDSTLVGWGDNSNRQIETPIDAHNVIRIECGGAYTYALRADGSIVGWGGNDNGQTGTPATATNVSQVACGQLHTYALRSNGTLIGWGYNSAGQTDTPADATDIVQVACGWYYTYALRSNGTLIGWGSNAEGERNTPSSAAVFTQIACGYSHTYALYEGDCDADGALDRSAISAGSVQDLNNNVMPDSCELSYGWEEDCNLNNIIDSFEQSMNQAARADSGPLPRIGFGHAQQWVYASPSLSLDDPVLTIRASGDFSAPGETLTVTLNGRFVGTFFTDGTDKNDCRGSITRTITLPRAFYNECVAAPGGATDAIFDFTTSVAVNADQCPLGSWVRAEISYTAAVAGDCNANSLLDVCEIALDPSLDANTDGVIDACQGMGVVFLCPGDLDGGGSVDTADLSLMLMSFGTAMPGDPADLDADGAVNTADISLMLLSFGPCG
jgi:hypothetical protein